MNTQKSMQGMGFKPIKQVELTNYLLNNLQHFDLKPTTKLVLLYLSGCYNPKKADVFPKQKTIADKMGISEASVIRAIAELHKEGLIISERKYSNRYKFTSKLVAECPNINFFEPDKKQVETLQKDIKETCKMQAPIHEQIKEQIKEQSEEKNRSTKISISDFEKLKQYATSKGAVNPIAYANTIIKNGNAEELLKQIEEPEKIKQNAEKRIEETRSFINALQSIEAGPPAEAVKQRAEELKARIKNKL